MELQEESPILVLREKKNRVVFGIQVSVESGLRLLGSVECGLPGSVKSGLPGFRRAGLGSEWIQFGG